MPFPLLQFHTRQRPIPGETFVAPQKDPNVLVMATECLAVEGATKTELKHLRDKFGLFAGTFESAQIHAVAAHHSGRSRVWRPVRLGN